jgi:transposase
MVLMAADGLRNDQIAARLRCGRDVVSQWRKRFFEQRLAGLEDRPRRGRPPTFPPQVRAEVIRLACELPADSEVPLARSLVIRRACA